MSSYRTIESLIHQLPRVRLGNLPTPLEEMKRLSAILGGPRIWMKRDDSIGLAFGGSKVRALEFTLADAIKKGADTIVTMGESQSNHARLTAAAARKLGLKAVLVIAAGARPKKYEGNLFLCDIFGADIRFAGWPEHEKAVERTVRELKNTGHVPYILPFGGSSPIGVVAYFNAALELAAQAGDLGFEISHVVHATASGGLQTGLTVANRMLNTNAKVIGVASTMNSRKIVTQKYTRLAGDISRFFDMDLTFGAEDLSLIDHFSDKNHNGAGHEKKIMNAIVLVAQTEGVILDPEYSGKAMAVLIDLIKQNKFDRDDNVVFIHTGGTPALFVQPCADPFPVPAGVIRLYRTYGKRFKFLRWLRDALPHRQR